MRRPHLVLALLGTLLLAACGSDGGTSDTADGPQPPFPAPSGVDRSLLAPLTSMGPCGPPPTPADLEVPDAVVLPDATVLTARRDQGDVVTFEGYLPWTPVQLRVHYENRVGDVELVDAEDEGFEAEVRLDVGDQQLFVKVLAVCEQGSDLVAVLAPQGQGVEPSSTR